MDVIKVALKATLVVLYNFFFLPLQKNATIINTCCECCVAHPCIAGKLQATTVTNISKL